MSIYIASAPTLATRTWFCTAIYALRAACRAMLKRSWFVAVPLCSHGTPPPPRCVSLHPCFRSPTSSYPTAPIHIQLTHVSGARRPPILRCADDIPPILCLRYLPPPPRQVPLTSDAYIYSGCLPFRCLRAALSEPKSQYYRDLLTQLLHRVRVNTRYRKISPPDYGGAIRAAC